MYQIKTLCCCWKKKLNWIMDDRWRAEKRGGSFANIIKLTMIVSILSSIMYNLPILSFLTAYLWKINLAQHINFLFLIEKNFFPLHKKIENIFRDISTQASIFVVERLLMPSGNSRRKSWIKLRRNPTKQSYQWESPPQPPRKPKFFMFWRYITQSLRLGWNDFT